MVTISASIGDRELKDKLAQLQQVASDLGKLKLVVGTPIKYMAQHQLGTNGMAKREFLGISRTDHQEIIEIFDDAIAEPVPRGAEIALRECGETLLLSIDTRWDREIAPDGTPWKKNTPYTRRLKKAKGQILKTLQSTGLARASINYQIIRE
jgi:hypothetical protein